jgi:uncharacterized protein
MVKSWNKMFTLKLDEIPEEGLDLKWKEERASLLAYLDDLSKIDFDFESPLQSEVKIQKVGQSVLITGKVPLREAPSEEETELVSEEMESNFLEGGEIHLSEIACEQIFLEIPYQPLCQERCKGLCSICGKDLNVSPCECVKEEFKLGFSVLKKLKLD